MIPLLLDALAVYRLTRLVTADTILDGPRDTIVLRAYQKSAKPKDQFLRSRGTPDDLANRLGINLAAPGGWSELAQEDEYAPKVATLVTCRWCAGMWVALAVVAARRLAPRAWDPLAKALAFSAGAALLAGLED